MSAHRVVAISEQPGVVYATVVSGKSGRTYTVTSRRGEQEVFPADTFEPEAEAR